MTAQALQFAGSLAAILILAWLARRLGLGGDPRLRDADEARRLADEAICGFAAEDVALDEGGTGALLRDAEGRLVVLRRHGARWAGRLLDGDAAARVDGERLTVATGDKRFGSVTLELGDRAPIWAARFGGSK